MKEIVYREAKLDEYQKIGKVLAGAGESHTKV